MFDINKNDCVFFRLQEILNGRLLTLTQDHENWYIFIYIGLTETFFIP